MREDPTPVTFRDVAAVLVMLTVVTAIALIVIGMIYLFAPPTELFFNATATTESSGSATAC